MKRATTIERLTPPWSDARLAEELLERLSRRIAIRGERATLTEEWILRLLKQGAHGRPAPLLCRVLILGVRLGWEWCWSVHHDAPPG
jgi:hypothetical protein